MNIEQVCVDVSTMPDWAYGVIPFIVIVALAKWLKGRQSAYVIKDSRITGKAKKKVR